MAEDGVFLELMQLVDAGRKVRGRESMEIQDEDVDGAKVIDLAAKAHVAESGDSAHEAHLCLACRSIHDDRVNLREKLRSQGQEFPLGLLS